MSRRLKDVPGEERFVPWAEYMEQWWKEMRQETVRARPPGEPWINRLRIQNARDNYGWRSLPSGTHSIDSRDKSLDKSRT